MKTKTLNQTAFILLAFLLISGISACKKDKNDSSEKTGSFKIDDISYSGKTSTQTFVNDNYSILCEQDEPYKLIQITFHNQAEAEAGGTFDLANFSLNVPTGEAEVGVDGLTFDPNGSHTISVTGKKITISNLPLVQTGGGSKHPVINTASINF